MNVTTNTRPLGYNPESAESNPQLNPGLLLCLLIFSLRLTRYFFSCMFPNEILRASLTSPIHAAHSVWLFVLHRDKITSTS